MGFFKTLGKIAGSVAGPLVGVAGTLLGGSIAAEGQRRTNAMQMKLAREQMDFQERMSSTAYQRSAEDLEAAGLNRILALGSPASSPSGAMATLRNPGAALGEAIARAPNTASALKTQRLQRKFVREQLTHIQQQQNKTIQETATSAQLQDLYMANAANVRAQTMVSSARALVDNIWAIQVKANPELQVMEKIGGLPGAAASLGRSLIPGAGKRAGFKLGKIVGKGSK